MTTLRPPPRRAGQQPTGAGSENGLRP